LIFVWIAKLMTGAILLHVSLRNLRLRGHSAPGPEIRVH